jgi:hypothetical protein
VPKRCLFAFLALTFVALAREEPPAESAPAAAPPAARTNEAPAIRPYEKVITSEAKTKKGVPGSLLTAV